MPARVGPPPPRPDWYDRLDATLAEAWRVVEEGPRDRRSPFHAPTLATIGADGRPRARTVVLRGADPAVRTLRFHCDRRSDKAAELEADGRAALHGYDPAAKVQIRLEGRASLHLDDAVADAAWAGSRPVSRLCYGTVPGPGAVLAHGGGYALPEDEAQAAAGRENFAAVQVRVERIEFLYLAFAGHRRARFAWDEAGRLDAAWLVP